MQKQQKTQDTSVSC